MVKVGGQSAMITGTPTMLLSSVGSLGLEIQLRCPHVDSALDQESLVWPMSTVMVRRTRCWIVVLMLGTLANASTQRMLVLFVGQGVLDFGVVLFSVMTASLQ